MTFPLECEHKSILVDFSSCMQDDGILGAFSSCMQDCWFDDSMEGICDSPSTSTPIPINMVRDPNPDSPVTYFAFIQPLFATFE
jgi:hypothetical protein